MMFRTKKKRDYSNWLKVQNKTKEVIFGENVYGNKEWLGPNQECFCGPNLAFEFKQKGCEVSVPTRIEIRELEREDE